MTSYTYIFGKQRTGEMLNGNSCCVITSVNNKWNNAAFQLRQTTTNTIRRHTVSLHSRSVGRRFRLHMPAVRHTAWLPVGSIMPGICDVIEGLTGWNFTLFLFLWTWLWPNNGDIQIWPCTNDELSRSRLSEVRAIQTVTQSDTTKCITMLHSWLLVIAYMREFSEMLTLNILSQFILLYRLRNSLPSNSGK